MPDQQDDAARFEALYHVPGEAPWTWPEPHPLVVQLVAQHKIPPGRVLEVACGEGYHAIYLASQGCTVVAIDRSRTAIQHAQAHASAAQVAIEWRVMAAQDLHRMDWQFDWVFDWRFCHELTDEEERRAYVRDVARVLVPGGKYLSAAFSGESPYWGSGTLRTTPNTQAVLYFARWEDLQRLYAPYFTVLERHALTVRDKPDFQVPAYCLVLEKM